MNYQIRALPCASMVALLFSAIATPVHATGPQFSYVPGSMTESVINAGPWTLHESADHFEGHASINQLRNDAGQGPGHAWTFDTFNHDASGIVPTTAGPPYSGSGVPYAGYCNPPSTVTVNHGLSLMQPYYFPYVRRVGFILEGFFDYRPRNEQEATVAAISLDWGASWQFTGEALALNPYCPWDATDPDNLNVNVNGAETPYGSSSANAADNGLGHAVVLSVKGAQRIYSLNRANGHIDSDQLVVHPLPLSDFPSLYGLPAYGYVSPLASGGYPTLDSQATATSGLQNPDAILGAVPMGATTTVLYVEKTLNADTSFPAAEQCPKTPAFALTNLINGKPRKANHDVTAIRVATTTDGLHFTDLGSASGLSDPTTVALNGIRYLGSGSILRLGDGRYGMFFGAGNCLDNDSDGFHFVGYAETINPVRQPSDLLSWQLVNGLDNPILSTDTVTDSTTNPSMPRQYPANAPIVNVSGADALTAAEVAPFVPVPGGYNSNFFSGRVYDPQALYTDEHTVTIVFAGYNTPQPSNNLGDYRTIGRVQLRVPEGYFSPF
jgi:hypothetical protein